MTNQILTKEEYYDYIYKNNFVHNSESIIVSNDKINVIYTALDEKSLKTYKFIISDSHDNITTGVNNDDDNKIIDDNMIINDNIIIDKNNSGENSQENNINVVDNIAHNKCSNNNNNTACTSDKIIDATLTGGDLELYKLIGMYEVIRTDYESTGDGPAIISTSQISFGVDGIQRNVNKNSGVKKYVTIRNTDNNKIYRCLIK